MKQTDQVLGYLEQHGSITAIEAVSEFGIMRLAAVVHDLKAAGIPIETVMHHKNRNGRGVHWAEYKMPLPVGKTEERQEVETERFPSDNIMNH